MNKNFSKNVLYVKNVESVSFNLNLTNEIKYNYDNNEDVYTISVLSSKVNVNDVLEYLLNNKYSFFVNKSKCEVKDNTIIIRDFIKMNYINDFETMLNYQLDMNKVGKNYDDETDIYTIEILSNDIDINEVVENRLKYNCDVKFEVNNNSIIFYNVVKYYTHQDKMHNLSYDMNTTMKTDNIIVSRTTFDLKMVECSIFTKTAVTKAKKYMKGLGYVVDSLEDCGDKFFNVVFIK